MTTHSHWTERLPEYACKPALKWCRTQPSFEAAWAACERGDWLLWAAARLNVDRKLVVRACCACAREALQYVPGGEDRPRVAIETAEAWTRGETTDEQVRAAASAAEYAGLIGFRCTYYAAMAAACAASAAEHIVGALTASRAITNAALAAAEKVAYVYGGDLFGTNPTTTACLKQSACIVRSMIERPQL